MSRERKGFVITRNGRLYVRVGYSDEQGRRHDIVRRATNRTRELRKEILRGIPGVLSVSVVREPGHRKHFTTESQSNRRTI
jgi:hypothetical protein